MKNWIYAALAALFATGCAPHGGYTLTGEVPEAWEGKPVVLFTTDAGQAEAIDSTTVANGKFRLQGVLDAPRNCRVAVYLDPENRSDRNLTVTFPVFLDSTAVNAVCDASKSDPVFTLAGGATQTEWQAYRAALEPLAEERNRAFRDYVEAFYNGGDEAKGIELARRVDEKAGLIRDFKIAYVREHPASAVSLAIVQELCDRQSRLDRAQMESLMDALAPQAPRRASATSGSWRDSRCPTSNCRMRRASCAGCRISSVRDITRWSKSGLRGACLAGVRFRSSGGLTTGTTGKASTCFTCR